MGYEIIKIDADTWRIEDGGVRFFLLAGQKEALLIDSGMEVKNAKEIAASLTDLPLKLLNTHADRDHVGSNAEFASFYMHPAEACNYYHGPVAAGRIDPIEDGQILDLGGRQLMIILIPGHTPGSVAILDMDRRVLYGGDTVQDGKIFMFGPYREMHSYILSMEKLMQMRDSFDTVYPSHATFPVSLDLIPALKEAAEKALRGELPETVIDMHGNRVRRADAGVAGFLLDL